jgi:3-methyl-2-oxobutanoate hydroxymethyltransferase
MRGVAMAMKIPDFYHKKNNKNKISMITCYDYTSARLLAATHIDCLLVGDTVAMTMHGHKDTLSATLSMMCLHTEAVVRGASDKFIISDMPFLSYRSSLDKSVANALKLMQSGAHALKLESASGNVKLIRHLVESGVPVMGHIGLTPQFVHLIGGYKVQGKTPDSAMQLKKDAQVLAAAGCFALVLECVPAALAKEITESLSIPTIGIGAGSHTDGQVLVFQDLLGLNTGEMQPKFVKKYLMGDQLIVHAIERYIHEIHSGDFPQHAHCYGS